jgi:large subunit ribosomal protein L13
MILRPKMKTYVAKPQTVERRWWVVDASDQVLGRLATRVATVLRGKHKPTFTPHLDSGDFVIVVNAEKIKLTGRKWEQKTYYRHSGYPGGGARHAAQEPAGAQADQKTEGLRRPGTPPSGPAAPGLEPVAGRRS